MVERANRTIKQRLYKYFHKSNTKRWINVIDDIVESINNSTNRSIGVAPNSVTFENAQQLYENLYKGISARRESKLKVGDTVRLSVQKEIFHKGYLPQFSKELFTIQKVLNTNPPTFKIKNFDGKILSGVAYEQQLTRASE